MSNLTAEKIASLSLPSQPGIINQLNTLISEEGISNDRVARLIETDVAFTARVLKLVNSPFYGFSRKIVSVEDAITLLGFNTIHQLLMATSIIKCFRIDEKVLPMIDFWKHSFAVGVTSKHLLSGADKETQEAGFVGGILHDVGRLIFAQTDEEAFIKIYSKKDRAVDLQFEADHFGMDHQEVGKVLADRWNFPERIKAAIAHHHLPDKAGKYMALASAINIADVICHAANFGFSGNYYVTQFERKACEQISFERDAFRENVRNSFMEYKSNLHFIEEMD